MSHIMQDQRQVPGFISKNSARSAYVLKLDILLHTESQGELR